MITIKAAKGNFFDRDKVLKAVDRATRKVLSKIGSHVWKRAKTSIKNAPKPSKGKRGRKSRRPLISAVGGPPYSRTGLLRKFIFFSYDDSSRSVVIGPAKLNNVVSPTALPALEYGGPTIVIEGRKGKRKQVNVKARPFMGPALAAEQPKFAAMWRDAVK